MMVGKLYEFKGTTKWWQKTYTDSILKFEHSQKIFPSDIILVLKNPIYYSNNNSIVKILTNEGNIVYIPYLKVDWKEIE